LPYLGSRALESFKPILHALDYDLAGLFNYECYVWNTLAIDQTREVVRGCSMVDVLKAHRRIYNRTQYPAIEKDDLNGFFFLIGLDLCIYSVAVSSEHAINSLEVRDCLLFDVIYEILRVIHILTRECLPGQELGYFLTTYSLIVRGFVYAIRDPAGLETLSKLNQCVALPNGIASFNTDYHFLCDVLIARRPIRGISEESLNSLTEYKHSVNANVH